jgi:hypothetical protein
MKTVKYFFAITLLIAHIASVQAAPMIRFWRGYQLDTLSSVEFQQGINEILIPWTSRLGTERAGLMGYLPVMSSQVTSQRIPEEFALLAYDNETHYKEFRSTVEGKNYGNVHWDYFDKNLSKSAVAEAFVGRIEDGKAYTLTSYEGRWDVGYARFMLAERTDTTTVANIEAWLRLENNEGLDADGKGHLGRVVLVEKDYIAAYDLWSSEDAYYARNNDNMDSPEDFGDYYLGMYQVGTLKIDIELPAGLRPLKNGEGLQSPIDP